MLEQRNQLESRTEHREIAARDIPPNPDEDLKAYYGFKLFTRTYFSMEQLNGQNVNVNHLTMC